MQPSPCLTRNLVLATLLGLALASGIASPGCKKDEPPPPLPSASDEPVQTPAPVLSLVPEDAGEDGDADAADAKPVGKGGPATSFKKCCVALRQNAKSAPPPTNTYMEAAAAICDGAVAAGQEKGSIVSSIRAALRGMNMPAECY